VDVEVDAPAVEKGLEVAPVDDTPAVFSGKPPASAAQVAFQLLLKVTSRYAQWGTRVSFGIAGEYLLLMFQKGKSDGLRKVLVYGWHWKWGRTHVV